FWFWSIAGSVVMCLYFVFKREIPLRFAVFGRSRKPFMKSVFLTGASSGIGLAIAKLLVAHDHEVWGTSRDLQRIPRMPQWHAVRLDLGDPRSVEAAFNAALAEAIHFDVLINNAGAGHFDPAELVPMETIAGQFQILVFGQIQLMQLALRHMQARGEGLIINVTSLAGRLPVPFMAAYNAAKAAMASFTMSIQLELPDSRVRLVDLQPGDICTDFNDAVTKSDQRGPRYEARLAKTWNTVERNMKKAPKPDLIARRVCELIDQANPPPRMTVGDGFQTQIAPFLVTMRDHLFDQSIVELLVRDVVLDQLNVAIDRKLDSIFDVDDAMKVQTRSGQILKIGKDLPVYDAIDTGLFICPLDIFDYLERAKRGGDCSLADGVRSMASEGKARAVDIGNAWWQDIDTPEMLARAETQLRSRLTRDNIAIANTGSDRGNRAENYARAGNNHPKMQD